MLRISLQHFAQHASAIDEFQPRRDSLPRIVSLCAVPRPCKNVRLFLFLNFSAVHGEPVQWATPTVLKINRHDYYQTADKAGSVQDSVRVYNITATIGADGKARIDSKLVEKESY